MRLLSKEIAAPLGKDGKEVEIPRDSFCQGKYVEHACRLITRLMSSQRAEISPIPCMSDCRISNEQKEIRLT